MKDEQIKAIQLLVEAKGKIDAAWVLINDSYEQAAIAIADAGREIDKATAMTIVADKREF